MGHPSYPLCKNLRLLRQIHRQLRVSIRPEFGRDLQTPSDDPWPSPTLLRDDAAKGDLQTAYNHRHQSPDTSSAHSKNQGFTARSRQRVVTSGKDLTSSTFSHNAQIHHPAGKEGVQLCSLWSSCDRHVCRLAAKPIRRLQTPTARLRWKLCRLFWLTDLDRRTWSIWRADICWTG